MEVYIYRVYLIYIYWDVFETLQICEFRLIRLTIYFDGLDFMERNCLIAMLNGSWNSFIYYFITWGSEEDVLCKV